MTILDDALNANKESAKRFFSRARTVMADQWSNPVAPGKWSPAQIADHIGVSTSVALNAIKGDRSMGSIPGIFRPIVRALFFNPTMKKGAHPEKTKGPAVFAPSKEHPTLEESEARLHHAISALEAHVRQLAKDGTGTFEHGFFGKLSIADYVRYNALHMQHHERQLPAARQ
jgi:hypothetical protein